MRTDRIVLSIQVWMGTWVIFLFWFLRKVLLCYVCPGFVRYPSSIFCYMTENLGDMTPGCYHCYSGSTMSVSPSNVRGFQLLSDLPCSCDFCLFTIAPPSGCGKVCHCGVEPASISFSLCVVDTRPLSGLWCTNISYHSLHFHYILLRLSVIHKNF